MASGVVRQSCQRIGCDAKFTEEENVEDSCQFHPGPLFHDGGKQWSCCKQKSHDFSMFLELPGCQTGKHTSEKPQPAPTPAKTAPKPIAASVTAANCPRCRQGFFCSDHDIDIVIAGQVTQWDRKSILPGRQLPMKVTTPAPVPTPVPVPAPPEKKQPAPTIVPKVVDLNASQTCKNKGCGKSFTEKENTAASCMYHPGPVVFHDRQRGWTCCDVHVTDFDEFLEIPPCTTGWHNANPDGAPRAQ